MVTSMFRTFGGLDPYEGINAYMKASRKLDMLVEDYKREHGVTRVTARTMAKLAAMV